MTNRKQFRQIENHFYRFTNIEFLTYLDFLKHCESHLLFITFKVRESGSGIGPDVAQKQFDAFGKLYFNLCKITLGDWTWQWKGNQPLTYAFVDYAGTKHHLGHGTFPHIHALMMLPVGSRDRYWHFIDNFDFISKMKDKLNLSEFEVSRFNSSEGNLPNLISYCTKGISSPLIHRSNFYDDWQIYPKGK